VPVQVTDGRGRFVRDLDVREFRVLENGQPQTITGLVSEDTPASVLLALDISASMRPALNDLKTAADSFLHALRATDVAAVAAFNEGLFVIARPGTDRFVQRAAVDRLDVSGSTALYDSVVRAVDLVKTLPSPRVLVFFTDGDDTASRSTSEAARMALQLNDVVLYLVIQGDSPKRGTSRDLLTGVAQETGGGAWFSHHISQLREQFISIVEDLTHRYVLTYKPTHAPGDGSWRAITVEVIGKRGDYAVRHRQGYPAVQKGGAGQ
jgi:VWFA-related protein